MSTPGAEMQRRRFLALPGFGLFVTLAPAQEPARLPARVGYATDFNAYLKIGADGRVSCLVGKVELGQGAMTSLPMVLAEELDVRLDRVEVVMGDTDLCPWDMGTFGSMTTPLLVPALRRAGAEARAVLLALAADKLGTPRDRLRVQDGVVSDPAEPAKSVTYAALVEGKRIERHLANVAVKPVEALRIIGSTPRRYDAIDKVTGAARYAADQLPQGLLHACLLRPPAHGARLKRVDTTAAEKLPGVRVLRDGDLLAVLHERPDLAAEALDKVQAEFAEVAVTPDENSIFDHLLRTAPTPRLVAASGDLAEGARLARTVVESTFLNSYVAHATIETHAATAVVENSQATIWASTQAPFSVKTAVAQALGFAPEKVRLISRYVGAGFGGKTEGEQAVEAARLARLAGRPVQVMWNRREEFFYDHYRPAAVIKVRSAVDAAGKLVLWDAAVYGAGDREAKPFYAIPHQRTVSAGGWMGGNPEGMNPFGVGPWRAPSVNSNTFARESQIDILAAKAGVDPVEFRLRNLSDERMRGALESVAAAFGWKAARGPSRRGFGVACGVYSNAYNATMAEVEVDRATGTVRVKCVAQALDVGLVLHPDGLRQQIEGGITMGLGYALTEELQFRGGDVRTQSFSSYAIPRFSWLPQMDIRLIDNRQMPAVGAGEPPIITMGAVVANAIFDATGARLYQLPMTPQRVKAALARA